MTNVDTRPLLCCLFLALSWSATVKRDTEKEQPQEGPPSFIRCVDNKTSVRLQLEPLPLPISYRVVCDAGSSGTKLKIYRVNRTVESTELPTIDLIYKKEFEPSIDTLVNDKIGLEQYMITMLLEVMQVVPEEYRDDTNAYLLATAGFRFLSPKEATRLLDDIMKVFDALKIKHFRGRETVGILSGEEEGVLSWVALNYLLGNLASGRPDSLNSLEIPGRDTVGLLEMGGGSTQIAFIPEVPIYEGKYQVTIDEQTYNLYVHSYLQFGANSITEWIASVLSESDPDNLTLGNPCMLKGDNKEIEMYDGISLQLYGTGDPEDCQRVLREILKTDTGLKCVPKPCAIGNVYQPSVGDTKFYATQAFTYAPLALSAIGPDEVLKLDVLEQEGFEYCRKNLSEIVATGIEEGVASGNCLMGIYIPTLFTGAYGFPLNTTNIKVTSKIGKDGIEWSLGVIVMDLLDEYQIQVRRR